MLSVLKIENLAIVRDIEIEFERGLNVLTGETGAGKSIVLKAIELLTGKRASAEVIRSGEEACTVEALFLPRPGFVQELAGRNEQLEELAAAEELLIRRVIDQSGRSKIYANGRLITGSLLQELTEPLIDLTAQHQHQMLLNAGNHLKLLDQFGVSLELLTKTGEAYTVFAKAERELNLFRKNAAERLRYYERIKDEAEELRAAHLAAGEREELEGELKRLANVETLTAQLNSALELVAGENESLEEKTKSLVFILERASALDAKLKDSWELAEAAAVQLAETKLALEQYGSSLEVDPERLEILRERIAEIARLERKYQQKTPQLLTYLEQIEGEIAEFEAGGLDEKKLEERTAEAKKALTVLEVQLTAERKKAAEKLGRAVEAGLAELSMKRAKFTVEVSAAQSSPSGADAVEFLLAANPGEPFKPLIKVASGGELSRILLVLKTVLNSKTEPGTQIFDEIDSGIGGAVAQIVGEKLRDVARHSQVILVTHAPQIAALADAHYVVAKKSSKTETSVSVTRLEQKDRIQTIAAMLAGKDVTEKFYESARELLQTR